jgi:hypothetical protein
MTTRLGVRDLAAPPLKNQGFAVSLDRAHPVAIRTGMLEFPSRFFGSFGQVRVRQLTNQFIANLDGQILQIEERPRSTKRRFFLRHKLPRYLLNPLSKSVIHDPSSQTSSKFRKPQRFPSPNSMANSTPTAKCGMHPDPRRNGNRD